MYVVGGYTTSVRISLYRYNPRTDYWFKMADMLITRYAHGLAAANNRLYVAGGGSNINYLATTESYDPETNTWSAEPSVKFPRQGLSLVAI